MVKKNLKKDNKDDLDKLYETAEEVAESTKRISQKMSSKKAEDEAERRIFQQHTLQNDQRAADLKKYLNVYDIYNRTLDSNTRDALDAYHKYQDSLKDSKEEAAEEEEEEPQAVV